MSEQESKIYEEIYDWLRFLVLVVAVVGPFHRTILVFLSAQLLALKTTEESPVMDGKFVERSELQKSFLEAVSSIDSETVLVYGERGGGKTSLIHHALKNRKGVIAVQIKKTAHNEAQDEMIENISRKLQIFKSSQPSQLFIEDVFSWCPVEPVVVISLEARCGGDALDGVITASKILSYENRHKGHARIVVDISGSRAAIEAGIQLEKRRVTGIRVGFFSPKEARDYVEERVPKSFKDGLRREQIAGSIVDKFDPHVLKLKNICQLLEKEQPTDKDKVHTLIHHQFQLEKKRAMDGWRSFCKNVETEIEAMLPVESWQKVAKLLLEGRQESYTIIDILEKNAPKKITQKDIGLANADADYHPFFIDPFDTTLSLAGKAVVEALTEKYNGNVV